MLTWGGVFCGKTQSTTADTDTLMWRAQTRNERAKGPAATTCIFRRDGALVGLIMVARYTFKLRKFLVHTILHADDTAHQIALGAGIAILIGFLPILGIQTVVAIALAAMLRANKTICVPLVWITNPLTAVPIYGACLALGMFVLPSASGNIEVAEALGRLTHPTLESFFTLAFWQDMLTTSLNFGKELWVGCSIAGVVGGMVTYFVVRWAVNTFRERHKHRIARRKLFKAKHRKTGIAHTSKAKAGFHTV